MGALVVPVQEQLASDSRTGPLVLLGPLRLSYLWPASMSPTCCWPAPTRQKELAIRASLGRAAPASCVK